MKDYKVGDTIYIKGKIVEIDHDGTDLPYCVNVGPINGIWPDRSDIIDELPTAEPVKPVLPKGVADELETTKKLNVTFDGYIMRVIDNHYLYTNSHTFWMNSDDGVIKILMDAWYNGYTIEQVPRYMVYVPGTNNKFLYNKRGDSSTRAAKLETPIVPSPVTSYQTAYGQYKPLYWFTDEEITKFDLQDCEKELVADD